MQADSHTGTARASCFPAASIEVETGLHTSVDTGPGITTKELGKTGIKVPAVALGTWRYQGGVEPLRAGIEMGLTFIDTAESYGTEEIVGQAVRGIRQRVFIATKASPRHFRRQDLIQAVEHSLKQLNTDYIDLYQLHWPNYTVPIAETMATLEQLVQTGKIRFIGLSNFSAREVNEAQKELSRNEIVTDQVRYSLVDRTIEDGLLQFCASKQITVLAFSPLASGPQNFRKFDKHDVLGQVAREIGRTRTQVALNWCLCRDPVIVIFKGSSVEHIQENCGALGWRLAPEHIEKLNGLAFERRGPSERFARRMARRTLQRFGLNV